MLHYKVIALYLVEQLKIKMKVELKIKLLKLSIRLQPYNGYI